MKGSKIHMCVTLGHHILPEGVKHVIRQPRAATLTLSAPMLMRKCANCLANSTFVLTKLLSQKFCFCCHHLQCQRL